MKYVEIEAKARRGVFIPMPRVNTWVVHLGMWFLGIGAYLMGVELEIHN